MENEKGYQTVDMMAPARDFGSAQPVQKKRRGGDSDDEIKIDRDTRIVLICAGWVMFLGKCIRIRGRVCLFAYVLNVQVCDMSRYVAVREYEFWVCALRVLCMCVVRCVSVMPVVCVMRTNVSSSSFNLSANTFLTKTHIYVGIYICTYICIYINIYLYIYDCTHEYIYVNIYKYI